MAQRVRVVILIFMFFLLPITRMAQHLAKFDKLFPALALDTWQSSLLT